MSELVRQIPDLVDVNLGSIKVENKFLLNSQQIFSTGAAFVLIDLQERLLPAMHEQEELLETVLKFLKVCELFKLPLIYTEQYPQGLGKTCSEIEKAIEDCRKAGCPILYYSKTRLSIMTGNLEKWLTEHNISQLIIGGVETHVCVYQSCRDLLSEGYTVFLPADMVSSRKLFHKERALALMEKAGAHITAMEIIMFDLLQDAKDPNFKACQALIK